MEKISNKYETPFSKISIINLKPDDEYKHIFNLIIKTKDIESCKKTVNFVLDKLKEV